MCYFKRKNLIGFKIIYYYEVSFFFDFGYSSFYDDKEIIYCLICMGDY